MCGQSADYLTSGMSVQKFNQNVYRTIVDSKASHYTFAMPTILGMTLAHVKDPQIFQQVKAILMELGSWYQIQDDYWDCFGDFGTSGKVGNDINEGKCTWLAVKFMETASEEQMRLFLQIYGNNKPEDVEKVKKLYRDVELPKVFKACEEEFYGELWKKIADLPTNVSQRFFHDLLKFI